jgi:uncharacterized protein
MTVSDDLQTLHRFHESGVLDDDEFARAQKRLLNGTDVAHPEWALSAGVDVGPAKQDLQARHWAFILHISVLAGFVLPVAGLIAPIVIWQLKKDEYPEIDAHGKNAVNWMISAAIYAVASALLVLVIIGIPMLIALGAASIVFPIIAAIKANHGELWKYPLAITFFN